MVNTIIDMYMLAILMSSTFAVLVLVCILIVLLFKIIQDEFIRKRK